MTRRRIVHIVYSFAIGGLENVIVQLINRLPSERYEHVVLSLTTISDFKERITRSDVQFIALDKPPGHAIPLYPRIFRLLRRLKPDVVHTCNLAALEVVPIAWLAGVKTRIHAEHGWDAHDRDGSNPRYRKLRRLYKPFVSHYIAVSEDLDSYLEHAIGIPDRRRSLIPNGVDTEYFFPANEFKVPVSGCPFEPGKHWLIGTIGRLQTVKNQPYLARTFVHLIRQYPEARDCMRLVIIGEGPLGAEVEAILDQAGMSDLAWVPGARDDIPEILRMLDCFTLPSQAEGTSCTLQEAMASGLSSVATDVGGTPALLGDGAGLLVPPDNETLYAEAICKLWRDRALNASMGRKARLQAQTNFALDSMTRRYDQLFS